LNLPELQEQLNKLETYHRLWSSSHFQDWAEEIKVTLKNIESDLMSKAWDDQDVLIHLKLMGLSAPKTQDDELRLYFAVKGVLGFWSRKLSLLETQSGNYEKTKRKILELGRNGDIGDTRTVPTR
jgi:hypothetical protein